MTCIVAIKKGKELVIAADGQVTLQNDTVLSDEVDKIINFKNKLVIGLAGNSQFCDAMLTAISGNESALEKLSTLKTRLAIRTVFQNLVALAKQDVDMFNLDKGDYMASRAIIGNANGLWVMDSQGYITAADSISPASYPTTFACIGSGELVAKGAVHALISSQRSIDISNVAIAALVAAERYVTSCGRLRSIVELSFKE